MPAPPPPAPAEAAHATAGNVSEDDLWADRVRRRHREGVLGFAGTYGAAVLAGAGLTGLILLHDSNNPHEDSSDYLHAVAFPLIVPIAGPIYLGGMVGFVTTAALLTTTGPYVPLAIMMAPFAYGFSVVAIADGVAQAAFLVQAFGWSDPTRLSGEPRPSIARAIVGVTPLLVPAVPAAAWMGSSHAQGLPPAVGLQLPGTW